VEPECVGTHQEGNKIHEKAWQSIKIYDSVLLDRRGNDRRNVMAVSGAVETWSWVAPAAQRGAAEPLHSGVLVSVITGFKPTANALPGGSTLLHLINGVGGWALLLALAGLLIGAGLWAVGSHSQNYQQSYVGRRAVLVSGVAALLIGAAPTLINFFFSTGHGIVNPLPQ
jgi:hypothetical protein